YKPRGKKAGNLIKIGMVCKGVTFDTGGISLKKNTNMHLLKSDMAGAAAVLGAIDAAVALKLSVHLIGIIPLTDNKPDGNAVNPGDVIGSYCGKTIEVIDTDAEGRLILADGLAYLEKNYKTDVMIDVSTLTGAAFLALGAQAGALFSNNDALANDLARAGERSGDRVWRMPLWDDYAKAMESSVADIKNYGGPAAGAVTAAKFLHAFIGDHPTWAHLDVAGLMLKSDSRGERVATGYGVALLLEYCRNAAGI
ncbi:MAG: M17 family metallopeptidase, partial [Calditrichota bacterium]